LENERQSYPKLPIFENKADIYAFAVTAYEVLFQTKDWKRNLNIAEFFLNGERPRPVEAVATYYTSRHETANAYGLIWERIVRAGWRQDPLQRGSFQQMMTIIDSSLNVV